MKKTLILLLAMFMMLSGYVGSATAGAATVVAPEVVAIEEPMAEQIQSLVDGGMTVEAAVAQLVAANRDKAAEIVAAAINYAPNAKQAIVSAAKRAAPTESAKIDGAAATAGSESTAAGGPTASGPAKATFGNTFHSIPGGGGTVSPS